MITPNPYDSPKANPPQPRPPRRAVFEVGIKERHVVEIFLSLWGTEVYCVDGIEVLRITSLALTATRQFNVGETEKHLVEVKVDMFPSWKGLIRPHWKAEAYVDGQLVVVELFENLRRNLEMIHRLFMYILVVSFVLLIVVLVLLAVLGLVLQRIA